MSWSQESQSPEALSDPLPRIYACFCEKRFTTYPGIYLHLKSKHSHLFQKYKKLKITKLFKKTHDDKGAEIYRLEKLSENEGLGSYFRQKKNKQNKKRKRVPKQNLDISSAENRQEEPEKKVEAANLEGKTQEKHQNTFPSVVFPQMNIMKTVPPMAQMPQMNNYMTFPSHQVNYSFMTPQVPSAHPQYSVQPLSSPLPYIQQKPTIKKIMEKFFFESSIMDRSLLKITLYDLMIFIDKNYLILQDTRATGKQFLSYCDQFDPLFIKPLLQEHIGKMNNELENIEDEDLQATRKKEIDYLVKFLVWLGQLGLISLSLKITSNIKQEEPSTINRQVSLSTSFKNDIQSDVELIVKRQQNRNK